MVTEYDVVENGSPADRCQVILALCNLPTCPLQCTQELERERGSTPCIALTKESISVVFHALSAARTCRHNNPFTDFVCQDM